jgi:hypothetical protein
LAAKVLVVINRPRLKVLPSSLLPLARNASFKKGVFVSALIPAFVKTTTFREEEEEEEAQEAQENAARIIYLFSLSRESRNVPKKRVCVLFFFHLGFGSLLRVCWLPSKTAIGYQNQKIGLDWVPFLGFGTQSRFYSLAAELLFEVNAIF